MIVAECPKIFHVQCIWEKIFVFLEKILFLSIRRLYFIWFLREIYMEKVLKEIFWAPIPFKWYQNTFGCGTVN